MNKTSRFVFYSNDGKFCVEQSSPRNTYINITPTTQLHVLLEFGRVEYYDSRIILKFYTSKDDFFFARKIQDTYESLPLYEMTDEENSWLKNDLEEIQQRIFEHHLTSQLVFVTEAIAVLKYCLFSEL